MLYPGHTSIQCFILFAFFFFMSTHFGVIWLSPRRSVCWGGGACAWCCWVAPLGLCVLPLCMLDCNEATSLNCSEGWLSQREPYYTLGSICTRLFFLLLLLHPIFWLPRYRTCCWPLMHRAGELEEQGRHPFSSLMVIPITIRFQSQIVQSGSVYFMDSDWLYWVHLYCCSLQLLKRVGDEEDRAQVTFVCRRH